MGRLVIGRLVMGRLVMRCLVMGGFIKSVIVLQIKLKFPVGNILKIVVLHMYVRLSRSQFLLNRF